MARLPSVLVAFEPWRSRAPAPDRAALRGRIERRLERAAVEPTFGYTATGLYVDRLSVTGLVAAVDEGARGDVWAMVVCAKPPKMPVLALDRAAVLARRAPTGAVVRPDPRDPRVPVVSAALDLHVAVLRRRRPAAWRAIDAAARHPTRTAAAEELGCTLQAVSRQLRENHGQAARQAVVLFSALLAPAAPSADAGAGAGAGAAQSQRGHYPWDQ